MNDKQKQALYRAIVKLLVWKAIVAMDRQWNSIDYKVHEALELLTEVVSESAYKSSFREDVLTLTGQEIHNDVLRERPLDDIPF